MTHRNRYGQLRIDKTESQTTIPFFVEVQDFFRQ
jgi:hypothetical protein